MKKLKVIKVDQDTITFSNGIELSSYHESDCCESHYLCMEDLTIDDFNGLEFDLTDDKFFKRIDGYGIGLIPVHGYSVRIPGYGFNNGYYSSQLDLTLNGKNGFNKTYDVSDCQIIED